MEQYEASKFGEIFNTTLNGTRTTGMSRWLFQLLGGYLYVVALIGILANGTSLFIFCKTSRLRAPINMLVVGLLFADLTRSIFGIPLAASSTYAGHWLWGFPVCIFQGIVVYFCGLSSMYILMTISIHRYFLVIKQINITMVTYTPVGISLLCCFFFGLFWSIIPFSGWTRYDYESIRTSCTIAYDSTDDKVLSYNIAIFVFCFMLPVSTMVYCYYHILLKIRFKKSVWDQKSRYMKKRIILERRLTKTFVLMIVVFLISWTPYAFVVFWRICGFEELPLVATALPAIFAKSSSVWNPFLYAFSNTQFRKALAEHFPCKHLRNNINMTILVAVKETVQYDLVGQENELQNNGVMYDTGV